MTLRITISIILFVSQRENTPAKFRNLRSQTQLTTWSLIRARFSEK